MNDRGDTTTNNTTTTTFSSHNTLIQSEPQVKSSVNKIHMIENYSVNAHQPTNIMKDLNETKIELNDREEELSSSTGNIH